MNDQVTIELKAYKTFHGHDGFGWQASLWINGKRVGVVVEDGWGGPLQMHFTPKNIDQSKELYDLAVKAIEAQPPWESGYEDKGMIDMNFDVFMGGLAEKADLKKQTSRKVLVRNNENEFDVRAIKSLAPKQLTKELRQQLEEKFDGVILNGTDQVLPKATITIGVNGTS